MDLIAPFPVKGLAATLNWEGDIPGMGDPVPPAAHWLYFLDTTPQSGLGYDGHPEKGGFLPPMPLPRRMWAGGRIRFAADLCIGETAKRVSTIKDVAVKRGKSGALGFVTVEHRVLNEAGETAVLEDHDIVYREPAKPDGPAPKPEAAPDDADWGREVMADEALLFRYSALTFNGHRIHYDQPFCVNDEGYGGLIVHGPLLATYLMDLGRRRGEGDLKTFDYRARRPVFVDGSPFFVRGKGGGAAASLWVSDSSGYLAMTAEAAFGRAS